MPGSTSPSDDDRNNNGMNQNQNQRNPLKRLNQGSSSSIPAANCHDYNRRRNKSSSKSISNASHPSPTNNKRSSPVQNSSHPLPSPNHQTTTCFFNKDADSPRGRDSAGRDKAEASPLPDKHTLQLVIDTLQRRDTYEIFAEPVDPNEVEDYYQIVKEPMDFGTMRAKLHEGMYHSLDEFKHDVFLITRNAMHFNSSATIYFRQARAIHELAKRVFRVLLTAPQNFELNFSGARRRSTRRTPTLHKPSTVTSFVSPRSTGTICTSTLEKNARERPCIAGLAIQTKRNYFGFFRGARDGQQANHVEMDRRCTYRSSASSPSGHDNDLVGSKCFPSNPLVPTNGQADANYRKSLLLFVKDLGPTAQMIATEKIEGLFENYSSSGAAKVTGWAECEVPDAGWGSILRGSSHLDGLGTTARHNITGSLHFGGCNSCSVHNTTPGTNGLSNAKVGGEAYSSKKRMKKTGGGAAGEDSVSYTEGMTCRSAADREKWEVMQNERSREFLLGSGSCDASASRFTGAVGGGKLDENARAVPVVLALEHYHCRSNANISNECRWRNKKSCRGSSSATAGSSLVEVSNMDSFPLEHDQAVSSCSLGTETQKLQMLEEEASKKKKKMREEGVEEERVSGGPSNSFAFTLGFLKAQLNQMKGAGRRHH